MPIEDSFKVDLDGLDRLEREARETKSDVEYEEARTAALDALRPMLGLIELLGQELLEMKWQFLPDDDSTYVGWRKRMKDSLDTALTAWEQAKGGK